MQTRCAWCGSAVPQDDGVPALLKVCSSCANNGRLKLQPEPPLSSQWSGEDPDAIAGTPTWIRWTASGLLLFILLSWVFTAI